MNQVAVEKPQPLVWKTNLEGGPFVRIHWTSVEHFAQLLKDPVSVRKYVENSDVLTFGKASLPEEILRVFGVVTEPSGLIKGWYLSADQYDRSQTVRSMLVARSRVRPEVGLVKTEESPDFENCRGIIHLEFSQRWLPVSLGGLTAYTFYNDFQDGRPGYFLFQGGSIYRLIKFEVKTAPEYSARLLEKLRDDRYTEVYLRAVHPP